MQTVLPTAGCITTQQQCILFFKKVGVCLLGRGEGDFGSLKCSFLAKEYYFCHSEIIGECCNN